MSSLTKEQAKIEKLLPEIRATHAAFLRSGQETVELAREIGERLLQLKECVKHGEWQGVVEDRCEFSLRTATTYMKLASGWAKIKKADAAAATIDGCIKLIGNDPGRKPNRQASPNSPNSGNTSAPHREKSSPRTSKPDSPANPSGPNPPLPPEGTVSQADQGSQGESGGNLGKCPNCAGTKWDDDDTGISCAKCGHPHGEPAGDVDANRIVDQRAKTVKTVEALMRAFDDLNHLCRHPKEHANAIAQCKFLLKEAREWK